MSESIKLQGPIEWSDAECWVWEEILAGRIADFNKRYNKKLDPSVAVGWEDKLKNRQLSQNFILTILTTEKYNSAIPFQGIRIVGAYLTEDIDFQHIRLEKQLWLEFCRFIGSINFINLQISDWFSLEGSYIGGSLNLNGAKLSSYVSLREVTIKGYIDLAGARIGGSLSVISMVSEDKIDIWSVEIR